MLRQFAVEEVADDDNDLRSLAFEREMTGFEQVDLGIRIVLPECLGAGGHEKRIVLAPHGQQRRPLCTEILLEFGIERDITLVVAEQIELDLVIAGSGKECSIESPGVRRQPLRRRYAVPVLPLSRFWLEESAQCGAIFRRRFLPVGLNRIPAFAQTLQVGVAVLRDHGGDSLWMPNGKTKTDRCAVVENIKRVGVEADRLREPLDHL